MIFREVIWTPSIKIFETILGELYRTTDTPVLDFWWLLLTSWWPTWRPSHFDPRTCAQALIGIPINKVNFSFTQYLSSISSTALKNGLIPVTVSATDKLKISRLEVVINWNRNSDEEMGECQFSFFKTFYWYQAFKRKNIYLSVLGDCYYGDDIDKDGNDSLYAPDCGVDVFESFIFAMRQRRIGVLCRQQCIIF